MEIDISDSSLYANKHYEKIITDRNRYIILYGSRGSGKSYVTAQKIIHDILNEKYCKVVCLRKIFADIRDSQFATLIDIIETWGLSKYFQYTVAPLQILCLLNGNKVISRGLDKPTKLKSIKDPTIIWVEESNEITYDDFIFTNLSIRGKSDLQQIILTFNPDEKDIWINDHFFPPNSEYERLDGNFYFIKSTVSNATILHTTYKDNKFISEKEKEVYESLKYIAPDYYNTMGLGLWGSKKEGIVFPDIYYGEDFPDSENIKYHGYGLDWGYSNSKTAVVECCIYKDEIYIKELVYKTGLVNFTTIEGRPNLHDELKKHSINNHSKIFADSEDPKSIAELKDLGYNIGAVKKPKGVTEKGIEYLKKHKINCISSPNAKKEFKNYYYAKDKDGNLTNTPLKVNNHIIDAVIYWYLGCVGQVDFFCDTY